MTTAAPTELSGPGNHTSVINNMQVYSGTLGVEGLLPESIGPPPMTTWSLLTNHGQALMCVSPETDVRLRDIASSLDVTEPRAQT